MPNVLYCGDNFQVMREHLANESVDLVCLDLPFNSSTSSEEAPHCNSLLICHLVPSELHRALRQITGFL